MVVVQLTRIVCTVVACSTTGGGICSEFCFCFHCFVSPIVHGFSLSKYNDKGFLERDNSPDVADNHSLSNTANLLQYVYARRTNGICTYNNN